MIAPLNNGVNKESFGSEHDIVFNTITGIVFFKISNNVSSLFNFHNKEGEGRDPQIPALGYQKVLLLEECFQFFNLNLLCLNSLNKNRSKS